MLGLIVSNLCMAVYLLMLIVCGGILITWVYCGGYCLLHKKEFDQMLKKEGIENWGKLR